MKNDFLSKYFEYATSITDASPEFHTYLALGTYGAVLGRARYIFFGEQKIFPNIWLIILAPSSFYHKSTALGISSRCIYNVNPTLILPAEFSHEKIIEMLQNNPQCTLYYDEFKTLLGLLDKDYMQSTKAFLTHMFDCPDNYDRATKSGSFSIQKPCISVLTATTADWFVNSIKTGDIEGGFLGRFIFVYARRKLRDDAFPPKADFNKRNTLYRMLQEVYEAVKNLETEMELSDEAKKYYSKWYGSFVSRFSQAPATYRTMLARLNIYCLKFAIILESCRSINNLTISEDTIKEACRITDFLFKNINELCGTELVFTKYEKQERHVINILKERKEISRSELLRTSHLSSFEFNRIMQTLIDKELIDFAEKKVEDSQRKSTVVIWAEDENGLKL